MITARNYAAQATRGLKVFIEMSKLSMKKGLLPEKFGYDIFMTEVLIKLINESVHFALPDDGMIFDDRLKGIENSQVRLPFKQITLEYFVKDNPKDLHPERPLHVPKRLIYAHEVKMSEIDKVASSMSQFKGYKNNLKLFGEEEVIQVFAVFPTSPYQNRDLWIPHPIGWAFPSKWDKRFQTQYMPNIGSVNEDKSVRIQGMHLNMFPTLSEKVIHEFGEEKSLIYLCNDIIPEVRALLEFTEAMTCSNVSHEPLEIIDQKKNQKRIRDGKLPLQETRVLTLRVPSLVREDKPSFGGTHRSPKEHLRRGHIRRYQDGKNVWVSSCVVGAKENGVISKSYQVVTSKQTQQ